MKHLILSFAILFSAVTFAAPHHPNKPQTKESEAKVIQKQSQEKSHDTSNETYVYVCTGSYATKYHIRSNCHGLSACKGDIIKMTLGKAEGKGYTHCKKCYGK